MKKLLLVVLFLTLLVTHINGQTEITESIVALLNKTRNQGGIPSLILNKELTAAAQRHSNDMAKIGKLDHVGSDNSQFWERMIDAGYSLTTGAENILLRSDTDPISVFSQWWNSPPHQANMLNPEYVEVGLAYAQATDGTYYFTMVLGSRQGVVAPTIVPPTPIPPTTTPVPPTPTPIPPTVTQTPLPSATFTATPLIPPTRTLSPLITSVAMTPLPSATMPILPTATVELPPDIRLIYDHQTLILVNISGRRLDLTELAFRSDSREMTPDVWETEFLTEPLNNFSEDDCLQVWGVEISIALDKPSDCETRHGWVAVAGDRQFWKDTDSFFVLNEGTLIGKCQVLDGVCDLSLDAELKVISETNLPTVDNRDIRLIFNQESLTLLSITDVPIDIRGLVFQSSSGTFNSDTWRTDFMTSSLSGFPPDDCLMIWTSEIEGASTPLECTTRHGWVVAGDDVDFWRDVIRFDVIRDGRVLAGCVVANGFCDVNLNGNLGANSPTVVPLNPALPTGTPIITNSGVVSASSGSDLTLIYSLDSFTLINTSGHILDLSGLVFESDNGVFAASRWNTDSLSRSLAEFPSGDCLQIWGVNEQIQSKPAGCDTRHSWVAVTSEQQFWRNSTQARVRYGAEQIGTCDMRAGQCTINFP